MRGDKGTRFRSGGKLEKNAAMLTVKNTGMAVVAEAASNRKCESRHTQYFMSEG
ncbi:MAG: hypothetical protein Q4B26_16250 [Eubacteriales bacterium]|nr:hypothetical protein [Eubacteriales bacterium]